MCVGNTCLIFFNLIKCFQHFYTADAAEHELKNTFKPKHEHIDPSLMRRAPFHSVPYKLKLLDSHVHPRRHYAVQSLYPIRGYHYHPNHIEVIDHLTRELKWEKFN